MTGTIIISKSTSLDVRTIDFGRIADSLRGRAGSSKVVAKMLQFTDAFGMDMICADELNSTEFNDFCRVLGEIRAELADSPGLLDFIDQVCRLARADERFRR